MFEKGINVELFLSPPARHPCSNLSCRLRVQVGERIFISRRRGITPWRAYIQESKVRFIVCHVHVCRLALPTLPAYADFRARRLCAIHVLLKLNLQTKAQGAVSAPLCCFKVVSSDV